jgi:hypothetical protein
MIDYYFVIHEVLHLDRIFYLVTIFTLHSSVYQALGVVLPNPPMCVYCDMLKKIRPIILIGMFDSKQTCWGGGVVL